MEVEVFVHGTPHGESFWGKRRTVCSLGLFIPKLAPMK